LRDNPNAVRRVLHRIAEGQSARAACRKEGVSRRAFLRLVEQDAELRERHAFSLQARAHAIADELLEIADGAAPSEAEAKAFRAMLADLPPSHVESATRAFLRERTQRDRLRFDARRWAASKLFPAMYGSQPTPAGADAVPTVRVTFDPPPHHLLAPASLNAAQTPEAHPVEPAEWEVVEE
jgi:hypothetical protein